MRFPAELEVDGRPVGGVAVADSYLSRLRGLLGTHRPDGALLLARCSSVHGMGMTYRLDVALLAGDPAGELEVRHVTGLPPFGLVLPRRGAAHVLEARRGAFAGWGLRPGSTLRVRT